MVEMYAGPVAPPLTPRTVLLRIVGSAIVLLTVLAALFVLVGGAMLLVRGLMGLLHG